MRRITLLIGSAALLIASLNVTAACAPRHCKTTLLKYDHQTLFVTWFTLYNEMRFCYDGTRATAIEWTNNRTSSPLTPYGKGAVTTSSGLETYEGSKRRARNLSTHAITCAKVLSGFDVKMRQLGYGDGKVTSWRSPISNTTDC